MTALDLTSITHRYPRAETDAVGHVSLSVAAGEVVALIGPNGAGKSTLLNLALTGRPTGGEVAWFGKPRVDWRRRELARRVAFLPQNPQFLPGQTVADALAAGRSPWWGAFGVESKNDRAAVAEVADDLGLSDWLGRPLDTLSGGQRQRVFLGRCLTQLHGTDAGAVLLDEPDAHLDLARAAELATMTRGLADGRGLAVLAASHDLNLAARCADRLVLLRAGRVVATGPPGEVLTEANVSAAYGVPVRRAEVEGRPIIVPA